VLFVIYGRCTATHNKIIINDDLKIQYEVLCKDVIRGFFTLSTWITEVGRRVGGIRKIHLDTEAGYTDCCFSRIF
jgi:hypothetical protein